MGVPTLVGYRYYNHTFINIFFFHVDSQALVKATHPSIICALYNAMHVNTGTFSRSRSLFSSPYKVRQLILLESWGSSYIPK